MTKRWTLPLLLLGAACMPPPVETVDAWLDAYAAGDDARVLALTVEADRPLLERALAALETAPTSTLALSLPPRPVEHEIVEIAKKADGRQVIATRLDVKNPLPSASRRIGQELPGVPETRTLRRGFLAVGAGDRWRVKLDLERVVTRAELAAEVLGLIATGRLDAAEARLGGAFPPPPDDGDHQSSADRLVAELERRIEAMRARTSTTSASN